MLLDNEEFYRFMFWYCGDSKKTVQGAIETWEKYFSYNEEQKQKFDEFHSTQ